MSADPAETYDESLKHRLEKAAEELSEHFDGVLILASNTLDTKAGAYSRFSDYRGNFCLVAGMAREFAQHQENVKLAREIAKAMRSESDE